MNLGEAFHPVDTFKDAGHSAKGGGVLPAALPALGERRHVVGARREAPRQPLRLLLRKPLGDTAGRRHQGRGPAHTRGSARRDNREHTRLLNQAARQRKRGNHAEASPSRPTGAPRSSARWAPQDLHRRGGGAHGGQGSRANVIEQLIICPPWTPGAQVEAGGGDDGARRPRRHRRVHHRPGAADRLSVGSRCAAHQLHHIRGDEPGEGARSCPTAGCPPSYSGGPRPGDQAHTGGGDGGALPAHPLLPRLHGAGEGAVDKDGVPPGARRQTTDADLNRRKHTCAGCGNGRSYQPS